MVKRVLEAAALEVGRAKRDWRSVHRRRVVGGVSRGAVAQAVAWDGGAGRGGKRKRGGGSSFYDSVVSDGTRERDGGDEQATEWDGRMGDEKQRKSVAHS